MIRDPFALDLDLGEYGHLYSSYEYDTEIRSGRLTQPAFQGTLEEAMLKALEIRAYFEGQKRWKDSPPRSRELLSIIQRRAALGYALSQGILVTLEYCLGVAAYAERRRAADRLARTEAALAVAGIRLDLKDLSNWYFERSERTVYYWRTCRGYKARVRHYRAICRANPNAAITQMYVPEWERLQSGVLLPRIVGALRFGTAEQQVAARRTLADLAGWKASHGKSPGRELTNALGVAFNANIAPRLDGHY